MAKTFYGDQIAALIKAQEYCVKGGAKDVIPRLNQRIDWMRENDWELKQKKATTMEGKSKEWVNEYLYRRLLNVIPDSIEAGEVANALQDEVMQDIAETADPDNWHSGDIDISLARVLKKRLLNE